MEINSIRNVTKKAKVVDKFECNVIYGAVIHLFICFLICKI